MEFDILKSGLNDIKEVFERTKSALHLDEKMKELFIKN